MAGSIATYSRHTISVWGKDNDEPELAEIVVDSDGTAQIKFQNEEDRTSRWVDKSELLQIRAAINRALRLL
jgi:hypothetical protein